MAGPDAIASAALDDAVVHPCFLGWLDFVGGVVRATTAPYGKTPSGTGDSDLDGYAFSAISPELVSVSEVRHQEDGSETVTVTMAGLVGPNTALLNLVGDKTKWQGRDARLWIMLLDSSFAQIGNIWSYYTGRMISVGIKGSAQAQVIEITIESYLANFADPSGRTYLDQKSYDSGDLSAEAAIAIANGTPNAATPGTIGNGDYGRYNAWGAPL